MAGILLPAACCCATCVLPRQVYVTFAGITGTHSALNGTHTLNNEVAAPGPYGTNWSLATGAYFVRLTLSIVDLDPTFRRWVLYIQYGFSTEWFYAPGFYDTTGCDPFPYTVAGVVDYVESGSLPGFSSATATVSVV